MVTIRRHSRKPLAHEYEHPHVVQGLAGVGALGSIFYHTCLLLRLFVPFPCWPVLFPLAGFGTSVTIGFQVLGLGLAGLLLLSFEPLQSRVYVRLSWSNLLLVGVIDAIAGGSLGAFLVVGAGLVAVFDVKKGTRGGGA